MFLVYLVGGVVVAGRGEMGCSSGGGVVANFSALRGGLGSGGFDADHGVPFDRVVLDQTLSTGYYRVLAHQIKVSR